MATFKVGQRVRIVWATGSYAQDYIGQQATIIGRRDPGFLFEWAVRVDKEVPGWGDRASFPSSHLAPLTDPAADAFLARIKKLEREPSGIKQKENA